MNSCALSFDIRHLEEQVLLPDAPDDLVALASEQPSQVQARKPASRLHQRIRCHLPAIVSAVHPESNRAWLRVMRTVDIWVAGQESGISDG